MIIIFKYVIKITLFFSWTVFVYAGVIDNVVDKVINSVDSSADNSSRSIAKEATKSFFSKTHQDWNNHMKNINKQVLEKYKNESYNKNEENIPGLSNSNEKNSLNRIHSEANENKAIPSWGKNILRNAYIVYVSDGVNMHTNPPRGGDASKLIDGTYNHWSSSSNSFPLTIIFDLSKSEQFSRIAFINNFVSHLGYDGNNYTKDVCIQAGNNSDNMNQIGCIQLKGARGNPPQKYNLIQPFHFNSVQARYISISILSNYGSPPNGASLKEIMLFQ